MALLDGLQFDVGLDLRGVDRGLKEIERKAQRAARETSKVLGGALSGIGGMASGLGGKLVGAGLVAGAAAIASGFIDAGAQMEVFESRLTTLMGSASAARARLEELTDFAVETPFELTQIVAAEATLRGFGAAADELMPGLIDMASVMGGDLAQAATDLGKAWSQGAAGLESDAGRSLRKQIEDMSGVADATKMSLADFREAMVETLNTGMFAGGADKLSQTFTGMVSNLQDSWSGFSRDVADSGLFDNVKGALSVTLDLINENKEDTKLWAGVIGGALWDSVKGVGMGIAYTVDGVAALGAGFLEVKATALEAAAGVAPLSVALLDMEIAAARMVGADGMVTVLSLVRRQSLETAESFAEQAAETRALVDSFGMAGTAVSTMEGFFSSAEVRAKSFGVAAEEAARKAGGGGEAGDGDQFKGLAAGLELVLKQHEAYRDALRGISGMADDATSSQLEGIDAVRNARDEEIAHLQELHKKAMAAAGNSLDRQLQAEVDYQHARVEIHRSAEAEIERIRQEAAERANQIVMGATSAERSAFENLEIEKEALLSDYLRAANEAGLSAQDVARQTAEIEIAYAHKTAEERMRIMDQQLNSAAGLFGGLSNLAMLSAEAQSESSKEAARETARTAKTLAVVSATLSGIQGVAAAAGSAPPPYNLIPIAEATVMGAVQVAAAAATPIPSFNDTPRAISFDQRTTASFAAGDHVVAARDPQEVKRQADALVGASDGPRLSVTLAPAGRVFGDTVQASMRIDSPLRREIRSVNASVGGFR